ncbi:hypothetical protein [Streptomyces sp. NPDC096033]|uniref:hypothetical protein n=1 Tax=Streptomyces sp. NPDC096033 TaxID=3366071 RepID=UPI0038147590
MTRRSAPSADSFRTIETLQAIPDTPFVVPLTPSCVAMVADLRKAASRMGAFFSSQRCEEEGVIRFAVVSERRIRIRHLCYTEQERAEIFPAWRDAPVKN